MYTYICISYLLACYALRPAGLPRKCVAGFRAVHSHVVTRSFSIENPIDYIFEANS